MTNSAIDKNVLLYSFLADDSNFVRYVGTEGPVCKRVKPVYCNAGWPVGFLANDSNFVR
jgi:hypothetical protein